MVSIWLTYCTHRIYDKPTARDEGDAVGTSQSPFSELESMENMTSGRPRRRRGVTAGGSQQTGKTEFGFSWVRLLAERAGTLG